MNKRHFIYSLPLILLLIVAVAGWFATDYLGHQARREIVSESQASVLTLSIYVSSTLKTIEGAVKALSGSPWIHPALLSKRDQDIEHANSALDRYNSALNASVSYLMDANGMTVASSNRKDPDSFVGKSYRFRPYFLEAAKGQPYHYFALGITSGKRGFYASYPVQNHPGKVLGVITMKKDLDDMGIFFRKYTFCFLINPDGIIFLSSKPEMVLKSFWPLDNAVQEKLIASQQFGNKLSEAVMKKEIADGTEVTLEGKDYFVSRKMIDSDGWSIVLLTATDRIWIYKLTGILATIFVCFLIMVFSVIFYLTDRSQKAIRQSEESKRLLLHAAGEGIFGVDTTGLVTFINPAALRMLGFAEEEIFGKSAHALIHHFHEDGSNYPVEDCPMYASYTKATDSHMADEVLWRKDGSCFHVDYFSTPITKDGKVVGAVVTFRDITKRKQAEAQLKNSENKYRLLADNVDDVIFVLDMNMNYTYISPSVKALRGYEPEELMKLSAGETLTPASWDLAVRTLAEVMELEKSDHRELSASRTLQLEMKRKDGATVWTEVKFSIIRDENQQPVNIIGLTRDITERKEKDDLIKILNEQQQIILDSSPTMIFYKDKENRFVRVNESMARANGKSKEEMEGKTCWDIFPREAAESYWQNDKEVMADGKPVLNIIEEMKTPQGTMWVQTDKIPYRNSKGEIIGIVGFTMNITDRKLAEEALQKSEEKYRTVLENIQEGFFEVDLTGNFTFFNDSMCLILGYPQEEMMGMNNRQYTDKEHSKNIFQAFNQVYKTGQPVKELIWQIIRKDGTKRYIEVSVSLQINSSGKPIGFRGIARDITERKRMEAALQESDERYKALFDHSLDLVYLYDFEGRFIDANDVALNLLGYTKEEIHSLNFASFLSDDQLPSAFKTLHEIQETGIQKELDEFRLRHKNGSEIYIETHGSVIISNGKPVAIQSIARDITKRKQAEALLRESEERYRTLVENASDVIFRTDDTGHFTIVNPVMLRITGYSKEEIIGKHYKMLVRPDKFKEVITHFASQYENRVQNTYQEFPIITKDGHEIWLGENTQLLVEDDHVSGFQAVARDITDRRRMEGEIQYLATHDSLTGLPNRLMFSQILNHAIETAKRHQRQFAVLFIDLDRFKIINDTMGHDAGDLLLQEIAARLKKILRAVDIVGRLGGDEFIILIEEVTELSQVVILADKILAGVLKPITLMGQECRITASIGICMYPKDAEDEQSLMKNADIAMYLGKEEGKNNYQFYSKDIQSKSLERLSIETNLRFALERNELSLHYQAQVDFKTNVIKGVEALLRWQNPYLGSVTPTQFIPVAEESGLIIPIGRWVLKTACAQNVVWQKQGLPAVCVSVNLTRRQLMDENLIDDIRTALNDSGMAPNLLELDITEGMVMHNPALIISILAKIKSMGVRLAIDDFGTGYSSLTQIKNFPIDTLKVDRSFIRNIPKDTEYRAITEAIIAMGKTLGLNVVAEGVETVEQMNFLREHSCDEMQGFYFSKPIIPEQFADLLRKHIPSPPAWKTVKSIVNERS